MKMFKMPPGAHCIIHAAAMLLDEEPETLVKEIGHDGNKILWPMFHGNSSKQGYHIQEIIDCFIRRKHVLVPIELHPRSSPTGMPIHAERIYDDKQDAERFWNHIRSNNALLIGPKHAAAWNGSIVYDPNGQTYPLEDFIIIEAWISFRLK